MNYKILLLFSLWMLRSMGLTADSCLPPGESTVGLKAVLYNYQPTYVYPNMQDFQDLNFMTSGYKSNTVNDNW